MLKEFILKPFLVKSKEEFSYLPSYKAKEWEKVQKKELLLQLGKEAAEQPIPELTATMFLDFYQTGSRGGYESILMTKRQNLLKLIVAQVTHPHENFIPKIIDYVWSFCEQTSWIPPSHNNHYYTHYPDKVKLPRFNAERNYVDLYAGSIGALLSLTYYFFEKEFDEYSPLINQRIIQCVCDRVVFPVLNYDDFGWMGLSAEGRINNWNPWITYNALFSAMCMPLEQQQRRLMLNKCFLILEQFIQYYFPDGGCDEGSDYFYHAGGCLISVLDLISYVTNGMVDILQEPLIQNIALYAERAALFDNVYANFGDNSPRQFTYSDILYFMGQKTGCESLVRYGLKRRQAFENKEMDTATNTDYPQMRIMKLFRIAEMDQQPPVDYQPERTCFMKDTMILTSRQCPETGMGFSIGAKGGQNDESHNHNDVGQVMVYFDKKPVIVDPGNTVYEAKTFSPQRYKIPNMQSGCHNLPTVNGVMQKDGNQYRAEFVDFQDDEDKTLLSYEIGKAYPSEAGINFLKRTTTLDRKKGIVTIADDFSIQKGEIVWNLMVYGKPEISDNQIKTISGCTICVQGINVEISACYAEELDQVRVKQNWDEPLYHVTLKGTDLSIGTLILLFQKG